MTDWYKKRSVLNRQFSVQSHENTECLALTIEQLGHMEQEFPDCYNDLLYSSIRRLRNAWTNKLAAMARCADILKHHKMEKFQENKSELNLSKSLDSSCEDYSPETGKTTKSGKKFLFDLRMISMSSLDENTSESGSSSCSSSSHEQVSGYFKDQSDTEPPELLKKSTKRKGVNIGVGDLEQMNKEKMMEKQVVIKKNNEILEDGKLVLEKLNMAIKQNNFKTPEKAENTPGGKG